MKMQDIISGSITVKAKPNYSLFLIPCSFFLSFLLFTNSAPAQNLDSLFTVWNDQTQPDTTRLKAINKIAWDGYLYSQPDSAFYFAQMQYDLAEKSGLKKQMAGALNTQGVSFWVRGDYPKALDYVKRSLNIQEEIGDKSGIAKTLGNIGLIYSNQGDNPKALDYYQRCLKVKEEIGNEKEIATYLDNIGIIYSNMGDFPKALDYYQRSLKIREEAGDKNGIAKYLGSIGIIYQHQRDNPKSMEYLQRSLKIYEEMGDKRGIAQALVNIGTIYKEQGDSPKAMDYYQRGLKIFEKIGEKKGIAPSLNNIGGIYKDQGDYPKALDYYQRGLKIQEEIGNKKGIAACLNDIGSLYQKQADHQKAINLCGKGLLLAQEIRAILEQRDACKCLYDAYKTTGNGNKALEYHEQMLALDDSLHKEETTKKLQQMEFAKVMLQDSIAKADEARVLLEAHEEEMRAEEKTRNISIGIGGLVLLLAGGLYSRLRYVRKSKSVLQTEKDRSENLLLNILPADIAAELKEKGKADARDFDLVSILFTDFKGFTEQSAKLSAAELVNEINHCFEAFDHIIEKYGVEKIKTIGDAYMAAGGLPVPSEDSAKNTVLAALEMQEFIEKRHKIKDARGEPAFRMRAGVHTGPVVAGIVGVKKFQYDVWGDTVNTASRIESKGEAGKVNISQATYELLAGTSTSHRQAQGPLSDREQFSFESRGKIEAKGKGEIEMLFVTLKNNSSNK